MAGKTKTAVALRITKGNYAKTALYEIASRNDAARIAQLRTGRRGLIIVFIALASRTHPIASDDMERRQWTVTS
jgi:hypothetical protein